MKATEQYFPVVVLIMLYKVVLSSKSVDEILKCVHSNESYWAVLSCGAVCYAVKKVLKFVCGTVYYAIKGGPNLIFYSLWKES